MVRQIPPTQRLCENPMFVVRPSGGSLYLYLRRITNFRLKAGLRTFHTVSQLVELDRNMSVSSNADTIRV